MSEEEGRASDESPAGREPVPEKYQATAWRSLDALTEQILRRIMRVACAVGAMTLVAAYFNPDAHQGSLILSSLVTGIVYALTYAPEKLTWLSYVYPWALTLLGATLIFFMGPQTSPFLLLGGGLFIGSLVLRTPVLLALIASGSALLVLSAWHAFPRESVRPWTDAAQTLAAVIAPAAIAGRMLVAALARALRERQLLIEDVSSEREALKETVATLESTRHQLTLSQKQELVSQMAGGIAHDMNNALTVILGEASFLDDSAAEGRERILDAGAHAAQLTRQLMVFGRKDISQPRPIDLAVTLSSFQQSIERIMPSDIQVESSLIDQPVVVEADPNQLLQVVLNLASNAKDAMPGGGQLTISLKTDHQEKLALLTVSDTGEGIEEEMLEQIFDPFFTTKRPGKGTGLGLASVRNLIDQMGGSVHVVSQPGRGTSFEIRLPLSDAQPSERPVSESLAPSRTGVVLVVDDDVRVRAMIFTALERIGCHVLEAADPEGAGKAARGREQIDLLITDVVMAGGGGAEAIRRVKAESPMTRVLVMSGYADDEAVRRGISLGEYPFLPKPFTADELTAAVDAVLDESAEENQPSR